MKLNKPHTIECAIEARPEADVKWFKDEQLLVVQPPHLEQSGNELMFFQINEHDFGQYYCQATNYLGSITSEPFALTESSKYGTSFPENPFASLSCARSLIAHFRRAHC